MSSLYLFDIDGTLVHCQGAGRRSLERACASLLGEGALQGIRLDGMTDPLILEQAFTRRLGRPPTEGESAAIQAAYAGHLGQEAGGRVGKLPGADEAVSWVLGRGAVAGLATGNWQVGARIKLSCVGLWGRFQLGGFGCDAAQRAELVKVAILRGEAHLGRRLARHEVQVIGDTPRDVSAAHAAGATAVAVATGIYSVEELRAAGADQVYDGLRSWLAGQGG